MGQAMLRVVSGKSIDTPTPPTPTPTTTTDPTHALAPVEAVFAYWVWLFRLDPERTALGPARRQVIARALALYPSPTVGQQCCELALEGNAASAWAAGANQSGRSFNAIEWILRDESSIERWMRDGERVRAQLERSTQRQPTAPESVPSASAAPSAPRQPARSSTPPTLSPTAQAARERLRQFCADVRSR